uniref:Uncharacterized protein n=1 Tax=Picea sitchensis TaxID=3332 RepID=A9NNZ3_PICSI|nr:unknown [Picea sitchensis]
MMVLSIWWTSFLRCQGTKLSKPLIFIGGLVNRPRVFLNFMQFAKA